MDQDSRAGVKSIPLEPDAVHENTRDQYMRYLDEASMAMERAFAWGNVLKSVPSEAQADLAGCKDLVDRLMGLQREPVGPAPSIASAEIRSH